MSIISEIKPLQLCVACYFRCSQVPMPSAITAVCRLLFQVQPSTDAISHYSCVSLVISGPAKYRCRQPLQLCVACYFRSSQVPMPSAITAVCCLLFQVQPNTDAISHYSCVLLVISGPAKYRCHQPLQLCVAC